MSDDANDMRSYAAKERDKWLESPEGLESQAGTTQGQYLTNRLQRAFIAGYEAGLRAPIKPKKGKSK